MFWKHWC